MTALRTTRNGNTYLVAAGLYTDRLEAGLGRLGTLFAAIWLAAVGTTAMLGYVLASRALARIDRITVRAGAVARGDFAARLEDAAADDEIGRMTRLLNAMLERLDGAIQANRRFAADASHELRSPLTAMAGEIDVTLKRDRTAADTGRRCRSCASASASSSRSPSN